ncbi:hypothetical protein D8674_028792 [Pyrus ussuriensis x Pyrus communis]|uniref:Uncharacterized protein n=1 Tax=Pyrus ussuriensis x Pyrus communis TaxID=2448454 RepID=A0A5N5HXB8_9ROSA|nr:hypothetical protein D8674_028792 [Pyrus ussuriensis x Pyrus communis]
MRNTWMAIRRFISASAKSSTLYERSEGEVVDASMEIDEKIVVVTLHDVTSSRNKPLASEEKLPFIKNALCSPNLRSDNSSSASVPRVRIRQSKSLVNLCLVKLKVAAKRV